MLYDVCYQMLYISDSTVLSYKKGNNKTIFFYITAKLLFPPNQNFKYATDLLFQILI